MCMVMGMMCGGVMGMGWVVFLVGGMFIVYVGMVLLVGIVMLGFVCQFEKFQIIFIIIEGIVEVVQEVMSWVQDFVVSIFYELEQVMGVFVQLCLYGFDFINGLLCILGDIFVVMGKNVMQVVEVIVDVVMGENECLKEFGVIIFKVGDYFEYFYNVDGVFKIVCVFVSD